MSTQIKYTNYFGSPVTFQQLSSLPDFKKLTFVSDEIKMIETFDKAGEINYIRVKYYIDATENKQEIIQRYVDPLNNSSLVIYSNKQSSNGFSMWDWESYELTSQVVCKGKEVTDSKRRVIFICGLDPSTNQLVPGAFKYYYANEFDNPHDDILLQFTYDGNGNVDLIYDVNENFGYMKGLSLLAFLDDTQFSQDGFPWSEHPYYHSALPYLPTGNL